MKTLQARLFTYSILILVLFQLYGCTAVVEQKVVTPRTDGGSFSLILQPLPQEIDRLNFHIASVVARQESGREIALPLMQNEFSSSSGNRQVRLAQRPLPSGRYTGLAIEISSASLLGEEGRIELLPPKEKLSVEFPFVIFEKQAETLFLSLSPQRLVTDGAFFTPSFSLWKHEHLLTNMKGFVSNRGSGTLTVFNKRSTQVVGHIRVGDKPSGLALDQQRNWLYVALSGDNAVAVVEVASGSILGRIPLRFGDRPKQLELTSDGQTLLVLNSGSDSLSLIDTGSLYESNRIQLRTEVSGLFLAHNENRAYVAHSRSSSLSIIDLQTATRIGTVSLEESPLDGSSSQDNRSLYLINDVSSQLSVLDAASLATRQRIGIGNGARSIHADSASGLLYIIMQDAEIAVVDPRSLLAIDNYRLPAPAVDLTIDNEENTLLVVLEDGESLVKIDLVSKRVLGRLQLDAGGSAVVVMGER